MIVTRLKKIRKAKKMTQNEVAKKLNISLRMYQYYESGQHKPSWTVQESLEDLFDTPIRELLKKIC